MGQYKTPGVYIVEKNAFPNSVVEVATAVPAFIGYTAQASNKGKTLLNKAWRISSMSEFINFFGGPPKSQFNLIENSPTKPPKAKKGDGDAKEDASAVQEADFSNNGTEYILKQEGARYFLYHSMMLFFKNGGGACYVISVGNHEQDIEKSKLSDGIDVLLKEQEPTMVVIPDAMSLPKADCKDVQQAMLLHCGYVMKNRFAILDVHNGDKEAQDSGCIDEFREDIGTNNLDYAAAYYPWLNTSIVDSKDLSFDNVFNVETLQKLLDAECKRNHTDQDETGKEGSVDEKLTKKGKEIAEKLLELKSSTDEKDLDEKQLQQRESDRNELNKILIAVSPLYNNIMLAIKSKINLLPPSAGMAGIYSVVDNSRGVWKAPANVSMNGVNSPAVEISHADQEDLNVTTAGKSINAIRTFIGEGTLVWGARTLDGNSLDWRYINVRRTMIMLEESIKLATKAYVFEPNVKNTWVTIKSMISNFLTGIWKRGGLAGASPEDAFGVFVGLGETMTPEDILEGRLNVTVLVAISRPAEFIEITFQQQLQKS